MARLEVGEKKQEGCAGGGRHRRLAKWLSVSHIPKCVCRVSWRPAPNARRRGTGFRCRGYQLWGHLLCSQNLLLGRAWAARTVLLPPDPSGGRGSHHREVGQSHGGCGPGTAHCFVSVAHGHGCSQAGWLCGPLDVGQALAPGSRSHQPEEGEGDSHTEVLGGAEGQEIQSHPMIPHFLP